MRQPTKVLVAGAVALVAVLVMTGVLIAQAMNGLSDNQLATTNPSYLGMMGNGNIGMMGGSSGMMGGGASLQGTPPELGITQVQMTDQDMFSPAIIQIPIGTIVTWANTDTDAHTVTFMPMMWGSSSGSISNRGTFSHTFAATGTYYYRCLYHPNMVGEVIVTA